MIHLEEVRSTNTWLLEALAHGEEFADGTVVWTSRQTAGRGQVGNSWEAEPEKNLSMSMLLKPSMIHPREQFVISELTALAVRQTVEDVLAKVSACNSKTSIQHVPVSIKWPNDIYVGDEKIAGILIENQLQGAQISHSILGIGLNINQEHWIGNAPNPTSLKLIAAKELDFAKDFDIERFDPEKGFDVEKVLLHLTCLLKDFYQQLTADTEVAKKSLHQQFCSHLYRGEGFFPYVDAETGEAFEARIVNVAKTGQLHLQTREGTEKIYSFKEVKFVLPCGVTKE